MKSIVRFLMLLSFFGLSLQISSMDIAIKYNLHDTDLETFNFIFDCRYHADRCGNKLILENIDPVLEPDFDLIRANSLQKALFDFLEPMITKYQETISPVLASQLTPEQQAILIDLAKCLFFKLNCDVKSHFLLQTKPENIENLRRLELFKTRIEESAGIAFTEGLTFGAMLLRPLESYQDAYFFELSQKIALNRDDQELFVRFIRFIKEHNTDPQAEDLYIEVTKLASKLLELKNCLLLPECFEESTKLSFTSQSDAENTYKYNESLILQGTRPLIKAAYEYWQQTSSSQYVSELESRLEDLKSELPDIKTTSKLLKSISPTQNNGTAEIDLLDLASLQQRLDALKAAQPTNSSYQDDQVVITPQENFVDLQARFDELWADLASSKSQASAPSHDHLAQLEKANSQPTASSELPNLLITPKQYALDLRSDLTLDSDIAEDSLTNPTPLASLSPRPQTATPTLVDRPAEHKSPSPLPFEAPVIVETADFGIVKPATRPINSNNIVEVEQILLQSGLAYNQILANNLITKQQLLLNFTTPKEESKKPIKSNKALVDRENLVSIEGYLSNAMGYKYSDLIQQNFHTKKLWLTES